MKLVLPGCLRIFNAFREGTSRQVPLNHHYDSISEEVSRWQRVAKKNRLKVERVIGLISFFQGSDSLHMQCKRSRFWIFLSCDSCVTWHPLISCAIQWHPRTCSPGCSRWQAILDVASRRLGTASSWPLAELFAKTELERTLGRGLKSDF